MASAAAAISGGHLNPAVIIGLFCANKIDLPAAINYIVAQCLGGIAAALTAVNMGTPALAEGITANMGLVTEILLTFFLVFVIYGTAVDSRAPQVGALFIGLAVTMGILIGGPITGVVMNPARYLGPALLGDGLTGFWLYWIGPVIGGILAALCYKNFLEN